MNLTKFQLISTAVNNEHRKQNHSWMGISCDDPTVALDINGIVSPESYIWSLRSIQILVLLIGLPSTFKPRSQDNTKSLFKEVKES